MFWLCYFKFGVGDCPIGLLKTTEIKLMNWLDVGEWRRHTLYYNDISKAINFKHDLDSN
jgi:hypothetical protein